MSDNPTDKYGISINALCGKVVVQEPGAKTRAISANRAIEIASELLDGAAKAAGQRAGVKTRVPRWQSS